VIRREDWWERLDACVCGFRTTPFAWGEADCVLFAAACVEAMTGVDLAADVRGTYDDALGAARALKALNVEDVRGLLALHFTEVPASMAQRGDLAIVGMDGQMAAAVVTGPEVIGLGLTGLVVRPLTSASTAFRVP
jgi:hypothetical protein